MDVLMELKIKFMITLETNFTSGVGGFSQEPLTYKQVAREGLIAVYERSRDGKVKDYETIRIKIVPRGTSIFNAPPSVDDVENYPSTGTWGKQGFSFYNQEAALNKMTQLLQDTADDLEETEHPTEKKGMVIPPVPFTVGELAESSGVNYVTAFNFVKLAVGENKIKFLREERRATRGKPSKIYQKV